MCRAAEKLPPVAQRESARSICYLRLSAQLACGSTFPGVLRTVAAVSAAKLSYSTLGLSNHGGLRAVGPRGRRTPCARRRGTGCCRPGYPRQITLSPSSSAFRGAWRSCCSHCCAAVSTSRAETSCSHRPRSGTSMAARRRNVLTVRANEELERGWSFNARSTTAPLSSRKTAACEQLLFDQRCR